MQQTAPFQTVPAFLLFAGSSTIRFSDSSHCISAHFGFPYRTPYRILVLILAE